MIAQLTGTVVSKAPDRCIIDVNGVGYSVHVSLTTFVGLPEAGGRLCLAVHTYVREDQLLLYGFATEQERALFGRLIGISGVGPKTAMAILSGLPAEHLVDAIAGSDHARLSTIPGVGRKTAERIVIELKDRIARDALFTSTAAAAPRGRLSGEILSALTNLGYPRPVAEAALRKIRFADDTPIETALKAALRELCRV